MGEWIEWLEGVTAVEFDKDIETHENLQSGVLLCMAYNTYRTPPINIGNPELPSLSKYYAYRNNESLLRALANEGWTDLPTATNIVECTGTKQVISFVEKMKDVFGSGDPVPTTASGATQAAQVIVATSPIERTGDLSLVSSLSSDPDYSLSAATTQHNTLSERDTAPLFSQPNAPPPPQPSPQPPHTAPHTAPLHAPTPQPSPQPPHAPHTAPLRAPTPQPQPPQPPEAAHAAPRQPPPQPQPPPSPAHTVQAPPPPRTQPHPQPPPQQPPPQPQAPAPPAGHAHTHAHAHAHPPPRASPPPPPTVMRGSPLRAEGDRLSQTMGSPSVMSATKRTKATAPALKVAFSALPMSKTMKAGAVPTDPEKAKEWNIVKEMREHVESLRSKLVHQTEANNALRKELNTALTSSTSPMDEERLVAVETELVTLKELLLAQVGMNDQLRTDLSSTQSELADTKVLLSNMSHTLAGYVADREALLHRVEQLEKRPLSDSPVSSGSLAAPVSRSTAPRTPTQRQSRAAEIASMDFGNTQQSEQQSPLELMRDKKKKEQDKRDELTRQKIEEASRRNFDERKKLERKAKELNKVEVVANINTTLTGHTAAVMAAVFWEGDRLLTADEAGALMVWHVQSGDRLYTESNAHSEIINAMCSLSSLLLTASDDCSIKAWELVGEGKDTKLKLKFTTTEAHSEGLLSLLAMQNFVLSSSSDMSICVWSISDEGLNKIETLSGHENWVTSLTVLTDGRICSGDYDGLVKIWVKKDSGFAEQSSVQSGQKDGIVSMCTAVVNDMEYVFTASLDNSIKMWNSANFSLVATLRKHYDALINVMAVGSTLVSCSEDNSVKLWKINAKGAEVVFFFSPHEQFVNSTSFLGPRMVTCSADTTVKIWELTGLS